MTNKYLITLKPVGNYFLGGERSFGDFSASEDRKSYFAYSNKFPQQTTVLGWLRFELLKSIGCLAPKHREPKAIDLVGAESFKDTKEDSYGIIKTISPVFIMDAKDNTCFLPSGDLHQKENELGLNTAINGKISYNKSNTKEFAPLVNGYDAKETIRYRWSSMDKNRQFDLEDIFISQTQIGIKKNYKGSSENDAFFKQQFYRLKQIDKIIQQPAFAFLVEFTKEMPDKIKTDTWYLGALGADQSSFFYTITEVKEDYTHFEWIHTNNQKRFSSDVMFVLLSDAYVQESIFNDTDFAIANAIDFKYINSSIATTNFYKMTSERDNTQVSKSGKMKLIEKGSVLFSREDKIPDIIRHFENKAFTNIGYNHYQIKQIK